MNNNSSSNPLVSVIMNCRNGEAYLRESLDSVYVQNYANWEIIFFDNASTDRSAAIAKSYGSRLRYFKSDLGLTLGAARNMALCEAKGRYLTFLDCDDIWLPEKLKKQVNILESRKDIDFVYGNYFRLIMPDTDRLILALRGRQPEGDVFGRFLYDYPVNLQTVMLRMDVVNKIEPKFDDQFEVSEEFDFFMRILFKSKALYINEPLTVYRLHQNMSSQKLLHKHPIEAANILDNLQKMDSSVNQKYAPQLKYFAAKLGYWQAKVEMAQGNPVSARSKLAPYRFIDGKFFVLYIFTFLPPAAWEWLHRYKMQGKFSRIS